MCIDNEVICIRLQQLNELFFSIAYFPITASFFSPHKLLNGTTDKNKHYGNAMHIFYAMAKFFTAILVI